MTHDSSEEDCPHCLQMMASGQAIALYIEQMIEDPTHRLLALSYVMQLVVGSFDLQDEGYGDVLDKVVEIARSGINTAILNRMAPVGHA